MSAPISHAPPSGQVWNFNAGPGALPPSVLAQAQRELLSYGGPFPQGAGMSIMCMSHRSAEFEQIMKQATESCKQLLNVPDTHQILFLSGGGTGAFASVPLNLAKKSDDTVAYAVTGHWSNAAAKEAAKYAKVEIVVDAKNADGGYTSIPPVSEWKIPSHAKYLYICYNETQHGLSFPAIPESSDPSLPLPPLVGDFSSCFMSEPIDISRFALIWAGAQKNVGPAGVTIVIVRKDLLTPPQKICPAIFDYALYAKSGSLYNTPNCWSLYVMNLTFSWLRAQENGLEGMAKINEKKAKLIYDAVDNSNGFYEAFIPPSASAFRSRMNLCITLLHPLRRVRHDPELIAAFVDEAQKEGIVGVLGHRNIGALRISTYNAVPIEACEAIVDFMKRFQKKYEK